MSEPVKIYTKAGDDGRTRTINRRDCRKNSSLICALGEIDELNSFAGWAGCKCDKDSEQTKVLEKVQEDLYRIGAELAGADLEKISIRDVAWAEEMIDKFRADGGALGKLVRPGRKGELSARLHVCRSVSRRAERSAYNLKILKKLKFIRQYLNRLSDLFFVMAEGYNGL